MAVAFLDKIIVVGDEQTVTGFRLSGVTDVFSTEKLSAEQAIQNALAVPRAGIIVATTEVVDALAPKTRRNLLEAAKPVAIVIPSKKKVISKEGTIAQMVKKAIGIELK